jgi:hypothetical protein
MPSTNLFNVASADSVRKLIESWPDAIEQADERKGDKYWGYFERKRASFDGTYAFGVSGVPGKDTTQYLAITFGDGGAVESVEVLDEAAALRTAKLAMVATLEDWQSIVGGYDIGKAMTYHKLPLAKGGSRDLLRCVYFLHELIIVLTRVETGAAIAA